MVKTAGTITLNSLLIIGAAVIEITVKVTGLFLKRLFLILRVRRLEIDKILKVFLDLSSALNFLK